MRQYLNRRHFLAASAAAGAGLLGAGRVEAPRFKTTLHKALIGMPTEETLKRWKGAGFEGMEATDWKASASDAAKARRTAEKLGMRIHCVLRGWTNFNSADQGVVARDIASVETSLRAARGYGADAVLLVPCRIDGMPMPKPWEFDIEFDAKTGHLKQVVAGNNSRYKEYINAHDYSVDAVRKAIRKLIPMAEKTGVVIAVENVRNNLWRKPAPFANFIASFDSPWVRAYYDVGNLVECTPPQKWIRALGKLIVKCHVKDFKLKANGQGGRVVDIRDGSVNWPLV